MFDRRAALPLSRDLVVNPAAIALAGTVGVIGATRDRLALALMGTAAVVLLAWRRPEILLAMGLGCSLAGGRFADIAGVGYVFLVVGALAGASVLRGERDRIANVEFTVLALVLLGWLALRIGMTEGIREIRPVLVCMATIVLVRSCFVRGRDVWTALAWLGVAFAWLSYLLGEVDPTGLRFQGLSGNPNRMVFGLLALMPPMVHGALRGKWIERAFFVAGVGVALGLVMRSGSSQGTVGIAVLAGLFVLYLWRRLLGIPLFLGLAGLVIVGGAWLAARGVDVGPDWTTLSGRSATFAAGWQEILSNPLFGTGTVHVSADNVVDRAAHNATIGLTATGGICAGALWLYLLWVSAWRGVRDLRSGLFIGATVLILATAQLVQSVEYTPLTWAVLLSSALSLRRQWSLHATN